jgi:hypothetical protein
VCIVLPCPANGHIFIDRPDSTGQSSHFDRIVVRNGDVVLAAFAGREPEVASRLAGYLVTELFERAGKLRPGNVPWQFHFTKARK